MSQGFTKGVPIDTDSTMALNSDLVVPSQKAVRAYVAENLVSFTAADTPPVAPLPKSLWWNTNDGQLYIYYVDATSSQWVVANAYTGGNAYLPIMGGTLTGNLNVPSLNGGALAGSRNRIINGGMVIDQRSDGASITINNTATYTLDRWRDRCLGGVGSPVITVQRSTTAPPGFTHSSLLTVTATKTPAATDQFWRYQAIEGYNVADFALGTSSAITFTLSFWVRASVTGTYSVAFQNSAQSRSYVATYTVNVSNTWEYKTITVAGDVTGTWLTDNGVGMYVFFDTGSGSNYNTSAGAWSAGTYYRTSGSVSLISNSGATLYFTGVQIEAGSIATPFERRNFQQEMAMCQRYYFKTVGGAASYPLANVGGMYSATQARCLTHFPVKMRIPPTSIEQSGTAADYAILTGVGATNCSAVPTYNAATTDSAYTDFTIAAGGTAGNYAMVRSTNSTAFLAWSVEL